MSRKYKCTYKPCGKYSPLDECTITNIGKFCSIEHAGKYGIEASQKAAAKQLAREKAKVRAELKSANRRRRKQKKAVMSRSEWLAKLQALVNQYVRLRDIHDGCISCDKPSTWGGQWHASHYYSRGHSSALRFNLWNIHKSCSVCNSHLSGNISQYTPRLIEKIGQERYDWLTANKSNVIQYEIEYIKRAISIVRKAIKIKKNRL